MSDKRIKQIVLDILANTSIGQFDDVYHLSRYIETAYNVSKIQSQVIAGYMIYIEWTIVDYPNVNLQYLELAP